jgi:hypothetical protein
MVRKIFLVVLSAILGTSILFSSCTEIDKLSGSIATVGSNDIFISPGVFTSWDYAIFVNLTPTQNAVANKTYNVDLYEKGKLRDTTTISFTQPDINIGSHTRVAFAATADEDGAYWGKNINHIFSVKVYDPETKIAITTTYKTSLASTTSTTTANIQPSITVIYPAGGEIFHVGQSINIKWTTTNMPKDTSLVLSLEIPNVNQRAALNGYGYNTVANTGSFTWIIPLTVFGGSSTIGNQERINVQGIMSNTGINYGYTLGSSGYFSIEK